LLIYNHHVIIIQGENGYTRKKGGREESQKYKEVFECGKRGMDKEGENYYFYMKAMLHEKN
jgi:hypothetical protein